MFISVSHKYRCSLFDRRKSSLPNDNNKPLLISEFSVRRIITPRFLFPYPIINIQLIIVSILNNYRKVTKKVL